MSGKPSFFAAPKPHHCRTLKSVPVSPLHAHLQGRGQRERASLKRTDAPRGGCVGEAHMISICNFSTAIIKNYRGQRREEKKLRMQQWIYDMFARSWEKTEGSIANTWKHTFTYNSLSFSKLAFCQIKLKAQWAAEASAVQPEQFFYIFVHIQT